MNKDRFTPRTRASLEDNGSNKEYDFSAIAEDAVSRTRAQDSGSDHWGGISPEDYGSEDDFFEPPAQKKSRFSRKSRSSDSSIDSWDQPQEPVHNEKRGSFAKRRKDSNASSPDAEPAAPKRKLSDIVKLIPQTVKGKDSFDRPVERTEALGGKAEAPLRKPVRPQRRRASDNAADNQWDKPVSRADALEPEKKRSPLPFGRKAAQPSSATPDWDNLSDFDESYGDHTGVQEFTAPAPEEYSPRSRASQPVVNTPQPEQTEYVPAPKPAPSTQPERRVFNAATQPNYGYMTDSPASDEQQPPSEPAAGGIATVKASIMRKLGKDEPGVQYYTPPANRAPSDVRRHQKRRNRRPLPFWLKAALFGIGMVAAFCCIVYAAFYVIITSRIDYIGDSTRNTVYLSIAEKANHEADLTDTEENAAEFTEPVNIAEPREDVKVIMVVSSDSQLGDNGGITARTDAIMLIAVDPVNQRIRIASLMTDTYVRIKDYQSNKLSKAYYYDTVVGDYSLTRLHKAIEDNFGVKPDNYVIVDFDALQILVERLDGIDITVTADEAYYMSNHKKYGNFPRYNSEGPYTMSGSEALNYVRMRDVGNGDYDRVARQRKVFSQILVKMQSKSKYELAELAYSMLPELPTNMTAGDVFGYLTDLSDLASYEVTEVTFPITNSWRYGTATVRDEAEHVVVADGVVSTSDVISSSDVVSSGDVTASPPDSRPTSDTKFTVMVTNFQFNATALQRYLYDNDESYLNGTAANGVTIPEIIAPLESDSPAAGIKPAA